MILLAVDKANLRSMLNGHRPLEALGNIVIFMLSSMIEIR